MVMKESKGAIVLLSGGLDSTTLLAMAREEGYGLYALTFRYGQRHHQELAAAKKVTEAFPVREHRVVEIDLRAFGGSALTDNIDVPKTGTLSANIPVTYVPARNTIFLSYALAWAEVLGIGDIFIGVHAVDYSGYPDCRPEFYRAFSTVIAAGTKCGCQGRPVVVKTPLIHKSKAQIIRLGQRLEVPFALTWSCYQGGCRPCGSCESCNFREKGFREVGLKDPALSVKKRFNFRERSR